MAKSQIEALMSLEEEPVSCVLLRADGTSEQVTVDMTPQKNEVRSLLGGGQVTFIGQWTEVGKPEWNVMLVRQAGAPDSVPANQHTLLSPFQNVRVIGPILLFRNDENAKPVHFSARDYADFQEECRLRPRPAPDPADAAAAAADAIGSDEDIEWISGSGEEEGSGSEEEPELTEEQEKLLYDVIAGFKKDKGQPPTEPELVAIMNDLNEAMAAASDDIDASGTDSDFGEDEEEEDESTTASGGGGAGASAAGGDADFEVGVLVEAHDLKGAPQHNGKTGTVESFDPAKGRCGPPNHACHLLFRRASSVLALSTSPSPHDDCAARFCMCCVPALPGTSSPLTVAGSGWPSGRSTSG